ncbi:PREDICTED: serine/threonine protein phosphatase 2A 57 kDa regulatory subunit B' iota isoform-like [Tarenaya hassleriana]|uniref:serine/threonine protein phosphatase 2A 57 kDa regulatory subunit B' iota isoform-like n=1 Tax=Tarenaya hassleriana TaxID=28532 RepID=UPI00053C7286|nr:PREDICTED: serine/threonine protein phosphatase 2A 57 kDa regulatory subunit B' iota isoform-like [Tarenaya hassleriana]
MLKQFLSKLPKKSTRIDQFHTSGIDSNNQSSSHGIATQCTNVGNVLTSRLSVVKRVSSAVFPASIMGGSDSVDPSLSFKDISSPQRQNLFISKLNFCCQDVDSMSSEDVKRQVLAELVDFVSSGLAKFSEQAIAATCRMCAANLFRVFPPKIRCSSTGGEGEDDEPVFDPAWSSLQIVYDILLRFVSYNSLDVKVAKKYVDHSFIQKLLDLFDSDDPRERDCLKTILHRVYGKFMIHRPFIRKTVSNIIYRFVFETQHYNGIAELLEIFGSIISGFALPLKEEHKIFLRRALIPLHKPRSVGVYHQQLTHCVVQFIDKDPKLTGDVVNGLLKYWPVTNSQKELMFISELEEILEMTCMEEFQIFMVPLFKRIGCCLNSYHYQVAERAHLLWNNEHVLNLVTNNRELILPLVFSALEQNIRNHWNRAVLSLTQNLKKMLSEMDEELVTECQNKLEEESKRVTSNAEKRESAWRVLETAASNFNAPEASPPLKLASCAIVAC